MAVITSIKGNQLKIVEDSNEPVYVNGTDGTPAISGTNVAVVDTSNNKVLVNRPFGDYTTPSGGTATVVADAICDLLGEAAAANGSLDTDLGTLNAPDDVTAFVDVSNYSQGSFQYIITNRDTDVTIRFEGRLDDTSEPYNLDIDELDKTHTENGTFVSILKGRHQQVRAKFVSELGGTAAVIAVKFKRGN